MLLSSAMGGITLSQLYKAVEPRYRSRLQNNLKKEGIASDRDLSSYLANLKSQGWENLSAQDISLSFIESKQDSSSRKLQQKALSPTVQNKHVLKPYDYLENILKSWNSVNGPQKLEKFKDLFYAAVKNPNNTEQDLLELVTKIDSSFKLAGSPVNRLKALKAAMTNLLEAAKIPNIKGKTVFMKLIKQLDFSRYSNPRELGNIQKLLKIEAGQLTDDRKFREELSKEAENKSTIWSKHEEYTKHCKEFIKGLL